MYEKIIRLKGYSSSSSFLTTREQRCLKPPTTWGPTCGHTAPVCAVVVIRIVVVLRWTLGGLGGHADG